MPIWTEIEAGISRALGRIIRIEKRESLGGGCIDASWKVSAGENSYFVKVSQSADAPSMFAAEGAGLEEIRGVGGIRTPRLIAAESLSSGGYLALEFVTMQAANQQSQVRLGHQLAHMHRQTSDTHGWQRDNRIGSTSQINTPEKDWITFYREWRLKPQIKQLDRRSPEHGFGAQSEKLYAALPDLFSDYTPQPSLLHGDLWSGNFSADEAGQPVLYDPAVYYGDRETDLAMTELFGGFGPEFYSAYDERFAIDKGYPTRRPLYQLYHVLNHANIFGGAYASQALRLMEEIGGE